MIRQILFFIILTLAFSCNSSGETKIKSSEKIDAKTFESNDSNSEKTETETFEPTNLTSEMTETKGIKKIRFNFSSNRIKNHIESIEIKASLFNDNSDTVYFLSTTCFGERYSLRYDTSKFVLTPFRNCNASYPEIKKIAPKGRYDFITHFRCSSSEETIKLGFDFYSVDKSFDLTNKNIGELNIHNRPNDKQSIIWANEKTIKMQKHITVPNILGL